jgi:UDP-3-O-[3-hydroxymyristoyl] glucosamine N-acyltransferase
VTASVEELAALVGGRVVDPAGHLLINGVAAVDDALEGEITFFGNRKYLAALRNSKATAALVPNGFSEEIAPARIEVENPSLAFAKIVEKFAPPPVHYRTGVDTTAVIGEGVSLGRDVSIQPLVVIGEGVTIGDGTVVEAHCTIGVHSRIGANCLLYPGVTIRERTVIGDRVTIHSGAVIGSDGFGYEMVNGRHEKIPQVGIVQIDNDVEIGANTTIDRARFGRTWIQEGAKIDNLVQIAHNVVVGKHSVVVSQTGISGSAKLGQYVTLAGQVGVVGHVEIGDQTVVAAKSGVSKNVPKKSVIFGMIGRPIDEEKKRRAHIALLPKFFERLRRLEQMSREKEKSSESS